LFDYRWKVDVHAPYIYVCEMGHDGIPIKLRCLA